MSKKLRVRHFPQVPCKGFIVDVKNLEEAKLISNTLAYYDLFQYENRIKPDYANMTVVEEFDEDEQDWISWCDDETGIDDLDEYFEQLEEIKRMKEGLAKQVLFEGEYDEYASIIDNHPICHDDCIEILKVVAKMKTMGLSNELIISRLRRK